MSAHWGHENTLPLPPPPTPPDPEPAPLTAGYINAARQTNGLVALHMLPGLIEALEFAAANLTEGGARVYLYYEAARARALLAETP